MGVGSGPVSRALTAALRAADVHGMDQAAVALARSYAAELDRDGESLARIGPLLLACLAELRMTPKARTAVLKGGTSGDGAVRSRLDELRARRAAGEHDS